MEENMEGRMRRGNIESLRILAMAMVISMHYLQKGEVLKPLSADPGGVNLLAWLVESLCIGAANTYVLISGYFLVEGSWRWQKLLSLAAQIWVYSLGTALICLSAGIGNVSQWGPYDWLIALFPLQSEHYWFATAYIGLYLLVPILQAGVRQMSKRGLQVLLFFLLTFFSLAKTISPIQLAVDSYGYDFGWFICLFLVAAYIRRYGISFFDNRANQNNKNRCFLIYLGIAGVIWLLHLLLETLSGSGLPLSYLADMLYSYNHLLVLLLSVALFYTFLHLDFPQEKRGPAKLISWLAPHTLGVYLLHENMAVRHLWPAWLGIEAVRESFLFLPHMILSVLIVFGAGLGADLVVGRITGLFQTIIKSLPLTKG